VACLNYLVASGAKLSTKEVEIRGIGIENLGLAADPQMDALSPGSDLDLDGPAADEFELIPSLSLPPPIMPLRVYGHEFLAKRSVVQLSLGHPFARGQEKAPPVKLYSRSGQDSLHMWSSLKLVMTSKSDTSVVPHSVILPLADAREVFSFQVQSLERFVLEVSLYPTFGSKVIGRATIHPSNFVDIQDHKFFTAFLVDNHLKTIGEVAFEISCIRPFEGAQLEIGGRVETYWKSKVTPSNPTQDHAHQFQSHRPIGVSTMSPAVRPSTVVVKSQEEPALVTASSLSGDFIRIGVQVTRDGIPVVYCNSKLPITGFDAGVSNVTYAQFEALAKSQGRELPPTATSTTLSGWREIISQSMASVEDVLRLVPADVGLNLCLGYTREFDAQRLGIARSLEVNQFVDAVLQVVYDAGQETPGRKILFSSFDPTVCTALNWKQPNCEFERNTTL
jgi:CDK inhibitor PHO81